MATRCGLACVVFLIGLTTVNLAWGQLLSQEETRRQTDALEQLKKSLAAEAGAAGKFAILTKAMTGETSEIQRYRILAVAVHYPGPELDAFLTGVLTGDVDAGVRSRAATEIGRVGSEKCLQALCRAAATDPTTDVQIGCMRGRSSARRSATFAVAALAARFPKLADEAAAKLRGLEPATDPKDNESLADARAQALYQITRDDTLLKPFYERLRSRDVQVRVSGVVAFRFLNWKTAPAELVAALKDDAAELRSWTALVLGEIGDLKTARALTAAAVDPKEDVGVRCNAIGALGRMKVADAAAVVRNLLTDADARVQAQAAIALYRITGEKVKQFPEGYNAD